MWTLSVINLRRSTCRAEKAEKSAMVRVWETVPTEGITLILETPEFSQNLVHDKPSIVSEPTISRVDSAVSTEYRLATDRQTDTETNSRTLFPLPWPVRLFTKALAVIHCNPLGVHAVIIPMSVYFFIARPMSAT